MTLRSVTIRRTSDANTTKGAGKLKIRGESNTVLRVCPALGSKVLKLVTCQMPIDVLWV